MWGGRLGGQRREASCPAVLMVYHTVLASHLACTAITVCLLATCSSERAASGALGGGGGTACLPSVAGEVASSALDSSTVWQHQGPAPGAAP